MRNVTIKLVGLFALLLLVTSCEDDRSPSSINEDQPSSATKRPRPPAPAPAPTPVVELPRGIRVDPGYLYSAYPNQSVSNIATNLVTTAKSAGANQLYVYAYSATYGAYYPTQYSLTAVENGYGQLNIFAAITNEAKAQGIKVIAVVPLNNFKLAWDTNPNWRVKKAGNVDYIPYSGLYLLSASSVEYQNWYKGFIDDLVTRNPNIDGVEAVEPTLDYFWDGVPDQNQSALAAFAAQYPGSAVGSSNWLNFRAKEFLNLIALFNQSVHKNLKSSYVVQTWTIKSDGTLMSNTTIKNSSGFDFIGVATLQNESKTDNLVTEFLWQQWHSQYGGSTIFNPAWISTVGLSYINTLKNAAANSTLHAHFEISAFTGAYNTTTPTNAEFASNAGYAKSLGIGLSVYDFFQIKSKNAFADLSNWK